KRMLGGKSRTKIAGLAYCEMGTIGGPAGGTGGSAGAAATAGRFGCASGLGCSPARADGVSKPCTGGVEEPGVAAGTGVVVAGAVAVIEGAGVTAGTGSGRVVPGSPVLSL